MFCYNLHVHPLEFSFFYNQLADFWRRVLGAQKSDASRASIPTVTLADRGQTPVEGGQVRVAGRGKQSVKIIFPVVISQVETYFRRIGTVHL